MRHEFHTQNNVQHQPEVSMWCTLYRCFNILGSCDHESGNWQLWCIVFCVVCVCVCACSCMCTCVCVCTYVRACIHMLEYSIYISKQCYNDLQYCIAGNHDKIRTRCIEGISENSRCNGNRTHD